MARSLRVGVALLAGVWVFALLLVRGPPLLVLRILGADAQRPIDVEGGLRGVFEVEGPNAEPAAKNVEARAQARQGSASAFVDAGRVVVEVPGARAADLPRFDELARTRGRLELKLVVENSGLMRRVAEQPPPPDLPVTVEKDSWLADEDGDIHDDLYLQSGDRSTIEAFLARTGLTPDEGTEVEFEEVNDRQTGRPTRWRTYVVERRAILGNVDIAEAQVRWDESTDRPELMVTLTADGGRRFAEVTAASVGRKLAIVLDGRITSAPIIMSAITGGRVTIMLGQGDRAALQREAEDLAGALRAGPAVDGLRSGRFEVVNPRVSSSTLLLARLLCALAAALAVGLLLGAGPPAAFVARPSGAKRMPWARLMVTLVGAAVWLAGSAIPLPLLGADRMRELGLEHAESLSVLAMGLLPILSAFLLVELGALMVPRWRPLRHGGPEGRARLGRVTANVGLLLALVQSSVLAVWLGAGELLEPGLLPLAVVVATLCGGTFCLVAVAALVSRYGLTNGYSALIWIGVLSEAWRWARHLIAEVEPARIVMVSAATLMIALATVAVLSRRDATGLRQPVSGIAPLVDASSLLGLLPLVTGFPLPAAWLEALTPGSLAYHTVHLVIVISLTCLFGWLFTRHRRVPLRSALWRSAVYLVAIGALAELTTWQAAAPLAGAASIAVATAVFMDLAGEWRARAAAGSPLVDVWPLHQVQLADDAVAALAAAGVPAHLRGVHLRALLCFFGPFVPIGVLVPREQSAEAARVLAGLP